MPYIVAILLQGLLYLVGSMAGRVLVALGIGVVTYTGISTAMTFAKTTALSALANTEWVAVLGYMKVGVAINIVFSAMLARQVINGLQSDTVKRWVIK
ncbi:MAG: DUF2523 domain-containing protein [Pseudomonas sp.]